MTCHKEGLKDFERGKICEFVIASKIDLFLMPFTLFISRDAHRAVTD